MSRWRGILVRLDSRPLLLCLLAVAAVLIWSVGEVTSSQRYIDEDVNLVAGSLLLESILQGEPRGELAAHAGVVSTGPMVTVLPATAFRLTGDFRWARAAKYPWVAIMGAAVAYLLWAVSRRERSLAVASVTGILAFLSLLATPHLAIEAPQVIGEMAAISFAALGLALYIRPGRWNPLMVGAALGLATIAKFIVAPLAALLAVFMLLLDRRSLIPYLGAFVCTWALFLGFQAWELQKPAGEILGGLLSYAQTGQGSGLSTAKASLDLDRFGKLDYAGWSGVQQIHLWVFGASSLVLALVIAARLRGADARLRVLGAATALFIVGEWAWFTFLNDKMWLRHAVVAWALFGALAMLAVVISRQRAVFGFTVASLCIQLALGLDGWLAPPVYSIPLMLGNPTAWWAREEQPCSWHNISCTPWPAHLLLPRELPPGSVPIHASVGDRLELVGYRLTGDRITRDRPLSITLYWRAKSPVGQDYTSFVHLIGQNNAKAAQRDGRPIGWFPFPTGQWPAGVLVPVDYELSLRDDAPRGEARLLVGMYAWPSLQRLPASAVEPVKVEGDALVLPTTITVDPID